MLIGRQLPILATFPAACPRGDQPERQATVNILPDEFGELPGASGVRFVHDPHQVWTPPRLNAVASFLDARAAAAEARMYGTRRAA